LRLTLNPNYRKDAKPVVMLNGSTTAAGAVDGTTVVNSSQYHCPFTGLEMSGRYRFVFFLTCGCVVSERAAKNISTSICPVCSKPYHERDDLIVLNQIAKEKLQLMKDIMEEKRQKRHDGKIKGDIQE